MRVLYVSHSFPLPDQPLSNVGGMQRLAVDLADALGAHPLVRLSRRVLETSWERTAWRMVPYMAGLLRSLPRVVREERIDLVLFSSMVTATLAVPLRRRLRAAGVLTAAIPVGRDVTLPSRAYQRLVPRVFRALDLVLPISGATAEECVVRGARPERTHVVPCGVDLARFPRRVDRAAARRALLESLHRSDQALPPHRLLLCAVGRHQERKGFHWFVEQVMPRLPPDVVFLLAGDGPMTGAIRSAVLRHGLSERVRLLGRVSEEMLGLLYCGTDLFVMPNIPVAGDMEGFGVVMIEAGACGLPVVAADLEGIHDVVREGVSGHLLPTGDAAAFARTLLAYREEPERLRAVSRSAAQHTAATFSWPAIADRYVTAFRAALAAHPRRPAAGRPAPSLR